MKFLSVLEPQILGAMRIITSLLYTQHGCNRLLGAVALQGTAGTVDDYTDTNIRDELQAKDLFDAMPVRYGPP